MFSGLIENNLVFGVLCGWLTVTNPGHETLNQFGDCKWICRWIRGRAFLQIMWHMHVFVCLSFLICRERHYISVCLMCTSLSVCQEDKTALLRTCYTLKAFKNLEFGCLHITFSQLTGNVSKIFINIFYVAGHKKTVVSQLCPKGYDLVNNTE